MGASSEGAEDTDGHPDMHTLGSGDTNDCSRDSCRRNSFSEYVVMQSPDLTDKPDKPGLRRGKSMAGGAMAMGDPGAFVGIQALSLKGAKADHPNQDSWIVLRSGEAYSVYGVFDGHGKSGHVISSYVKNALPKLILDDPRLGSVDTKIVVSDAFARLAKQLDEASRIGKLPGQTSGTTATVAVHDHAKATLTIAHVGDSGCSIVQGAGYRAKYLTPDHKPNVPAESGRIQKAGGAITFDGSSFRVHRKGGNGPMLNMSRSFGDCWGRDVGLSSVPDVIQLKLTSADQLLILCSDGVWEYITAQDAADTLKDALRKKWEGAAHALATHAQDLWSENTDTSDDITVVLVKLSEQAGAPVARGFMKRSDSNVSDVIGSAIKRADSRGSNHSDDMAASAPPYGAKSALKRGESTVNGGSVAAQKARSAIRNAVIANAMAKGGREAFVGKLAMVQSEAGGSFCGEADLNAMSNANNRPPGVDRSLAPSRVPASRTVRPGTKEIADSCDLLETEGREMFPKIQCSVGLRRRGEYFDAAEHNAL